MSPGVAENSLLPWRTTHGLGIEVLEGRAVVLVPPGACVPVKGFATFTTVMDRQRAVEVRVVRLGGSRLVIGRFLLAGLRASGRGEPRIQIGLALDRQGILCAWAEERDTGVRMEASFSASSVLGRAASGQRIEALFRAVRQDGEHLHGEGRVERRNEVRHEIERIDNWRRQGSEVPSDADCLSALEILSGELASLRRVEWPCLAVDRHVS